MKQYRLHSGVVIIIVFLLAMMTDLFVQSKPIQFIYNNVSKVNHSKMVCETIPEEIAQGIEREDPESIKAFRLMIADMANSIESGLKRFRVSIHRNKVCVQKTFPPKKVIVTHTAAPPWAVFLFRSRTCLESNDLPKQQNIERKTR